MPKSAPQESVPRTEREDRDAPPAVCGLDGFFLRRERLIIPLVCLLACIRVLVYSAAFPPFGSTDEVPHYGLVCDYAEGHIPTGLETYGAEASRVLAWYCSPEYLTSQEDIDQGLMRPPMDEMPPDLARAFGDSRTTEYLARTNPESTQWPLYYAAAGAWKRLGGLFGLADVRLAYWIRFMNVLVYGLLVWAAYAFLKRLHPSNHAVRIGVPLMLAFISQNLFYFIGNDVLTPLLFTLAFYGLLRVRREGAGSLALCIFAGLSVAGTLMAKPTNIPILLPLGVVLFTVLRRSRSEGDLRKTLPRVGLMAAIGIVPFALWLARNYLVLGELSGSWARARFLTWSCKPVSEILHHPIFTPAGAWTFVSELTASFWRGEVMWHRETMRMPAADAFYTVSTLLFVGAAVVLLWKRRNHADERFAGWLSLSVLGAFTAMFWVMSVIFDFGACFYPSAEHPYMVSGRLMFGAVVPFLALYIGGLDFLMARARAGISRLGVLLATAALITASEIALSLQVFSSPWNWFHL